MWCTAGLHPDDGRMEAAAVSKHTDKWRSHDSYLGTGQMDVFHAELWAIGLALEDTIEKTEILQRHEGKMVAVINHSQAANWRAPHPEPGPRQLLGRWINSKTQALHAHSIKIEIHWVVGHSGIPGNKEADREANVVREARGDAATGRQYILAPNTARRISKGRSPAKAKWESDKCGQHLGYRLQGKAGAKRPIPKASVKSLATRFDRLQSGHAPTGVYLKLFGHRTEDKCC